MRGNRPGASGHRNAPLHRCTVVPGFSPPELAADVLRAIRGMAGVEALPLDKDSKGDGRWDAVIFVTRGDTLTDTFDRIARWRAERPAILILLAGIGLEAAQLRMLFDRGVHDFVSLPCAPPELAARVDRALGLHAPVTPIAAAPDPRLRHFIGGNPAFARQLAKLPVYAAWDAGHRRGDAIP